MLHDRPVHRPHRGRSDALPLSHDEAVALLVALFCAAGCAFFLLGLPTSAIGEEAGGADEVARLAEGFADVLAEGAQATAAPAPSNPMPLIIVVAIMGVALAIAFIVSRSHAKPQKLGGAKGDVW